VASDVRLGGDDGQTRLVIDLSHKIDIRAFALANPYRVVIDMPQVTFQFPAKAGEAGRGLIKAFRFGLVMQGGSRMVIDLARPARIENALVIDAANDQPARLCSISQPPTARPSCAPARSRTGFRDRRSEPRRRSTPMATRGR
jgi:N-acetylmuramoyl-L-alanine amidase